MAVNAVELYKKWNNSHDLPMDLEVVDEMERNERGWLHGMFESSSDYEIRNEEDGMTQQKQQLKLISTICFLLALTFPFHYFTFDFCVTTPDKRKGKGRVSHSKLNGRNKGFAIS